MKLNAFVSSGVGFLIAPFVLPLACIAGIGGVSTSIFGTINYFSN